MAKYIIDVPDNTQWIQWMNVSEKDGSACFDYKAPEDLTPYVMSESYIDGLKKGQNEAWDFATSCIDMDGNDFYGCFKDDSVYRLIDFTYSEAKAKYDEWKKKEEEIRVGDEVIIKSDGVKGVVLDEDVCGEFSVFTQNGCCEAYRKIHFEKTGRHLDGVENLLEEMREES